MPQTAFRPNHMHIAWHDYTSHDATLPISAAPLREKASVIGRTGLMLLSCGTGAWRVRSSMNTLAEELGLVCAADIGLTSIEYTCFDGEQAFSQTLTLTSTGVNTSKLNRLEQFVTEFADICSRMTGEQLHTHLDEIEQVHGLYSPLMLGLAAALACGAFTFLLGGGWVEMILAFFGAGIGNAVRCKLSKHHLTLVLCTTVSVAAACLVYAGCLKIAEMTCGINVQHEAGYICSMLFIIPGFPFITSGIDMASGEFIRVFEEEARKLDGIDFLGQGTIYPDIVESGTKTAKMVKSHHNVGGLPEDLKFQLVEPLRQLFKDEVRACGLELGLPYEMVYRQPFPGPGLGVRCLGAITRDRLEAVRESDAILREEFQIAGLDKKVWQYFTVVPDFKSVGVRDNARSFDWPVIIRAVNTVDAMTATIEPVDWPILMKITDRILKEVKNVNRVCYDMSPKPNATIEWE